MPPYFTIAKMNTSMDTSLCEEHLHSSTISKEQSLWAFAALCLYAVVFLSIAYLATVVYVICALDISIHYGCQRLAKITFSSLLSCFRPKILINRYSVLVEKRITGAVESGNVDIVLLVIKHVDQTEEDFINAV